MESRSATAISAVAKIRSGNKWKKRYCVLQRPPGVAGTALLHINKNVKCGLKPMRKKRVIHLEEFYGLESGFSLDKELRTLAIICHSSVAVVAFETDYALHVWELWLRDLFGHSFQYDVLAKDMPPRFSYLKHTRLRLHLRDNSFCLVHELPPSIVIELGFSDLRRFGTTSLRTFAIEAGTRVGVYVGVYILQLDNLDHLNWAFQMARYSRLRDYFASRDDFENRSRSDVTWSGQHSSSFPSCSSSSVRYTQEPTRSAFPSFAKGRFARSIGQPCQGAPDSGNSRRCCSYKEETSNVSSLTSTCSGLSSDPICHRRRPSRLPSQSDRKYSHECSSIDDSGGTTFAVVSRRDRPKSACETAGSGQRFHGMEPTGRPLSEIFPSLSHSGPDQAFVSLPAPSSACCRCRNYVNQPFIESLQYYYNIDHVVLALSRKSKCCDHVCAAEKKDDGKLVENTKNLPTSAGEVPSKEDEYVFVNVPSKDYAAMAPRGGLYVLMEPVVKNEKEFSAPGNDLRRHSEAPPDDPLQVDADAVVTVRTREESNVAAARSGIVVKPFQPIILNKRTGEKRICSHRRRSVNTKDTDWANISPGMAWKEEPEDGQNTWVLSGEKPCEFVSYGNRENQTALLNYATLATQDPSSPVSLAASSRCSMRKTAVCSSPAPVVAVEYAKIDEVATQAARKAVNELRTLSDGEQSTDTCRSDICQRSLVKRDRPFMLKKQFLRRRVSLTPSLSRI